MRTLGQIFRETRESKGITASQAAEATRIKPQMLDRMEADIWEKMPAPIYARGFIKIYAENLGLAPEPMIEAYTRWTRSDHKRPPSIEEAGIAPSPAVVPPREIPVSRPPEPKRPPQPEKSLALPGFEDKQAAVAPIVSPPRPRPTLVSPIPEPKRTPQIETVPAPAPVEEKQPELAPVAPPPRPRPSSVPRPAFIPSTRSVFAGMGRFLKYIPIGLVMILAVVLLFSGLKRWGRLSGGSVTSTPGTTAVRSTAASGTQGSTSGNGSSGLVLAEDPPATYFDDKP